MIKAKPNLYTASRKEEEFYLDAFLVILTNKIRIVKHKSKSQINHVRQPSIVATVLYESYLRC